MDTTRWYLRGLLKQAPPAPFVPFVVPATSSDGLLGRVETAAQRYYHTVNVVLCDDQAAAVRAWGERRELVLAWLEVLDAGDDLERAASALASVPAIGDAMQRSSATTVFGQIQELAASERKINADRAGLQQAVTFYLAAVDEGVNRFAEFLQSCDDLVEQERYAEQIVSAIDHFTTRIGNIQRFSHAGSGSRPTV